MYTIISRNQCNFCDQAKALLGAACQKEHSRTVSTLKKMHPKPVDNVCESCGDVAEKICLDHSHKTGEFRGWLCEGCNHSAGKSNDDPVKLEKLAEYLRERSS